MTSHRSYLFIARVAFLALVTTAAFAGRLGIGGGGSRGFGAGVGFRSPGFGAGVGFRSPGFGAGVGFRSPGLRAYGGGVTLGYLPRGYAAYHYGGASWYFGGGYWYRPWGGGFAAFHPPIGLCIPFLPLGYITHYYGGMPYYWFDDVYYTQASSGGYVVANPPVYAPVYPPAERPSAAASPDGMVGDALMISPKAGQSDDRMKADRQAARDYAMDESGFDPSRSDPADPGTARARRAYLRAMKSYLEERGYSVN